MAHTQSTSYTRTPEERYFRWTDPRHLALARERRDLWRERAALAEALPTSDMEAVDTLHAHGLRASTASLVEWLPAVDVVWLDGADDAERRAVRRRYSTWEAATDEGGALLEQWLQSRPPESLFLVGRRVLAERLRALDADARRAARSRIIAGCEAAGRASGGFLGLGGLSADERRTIESIRGDLTGTM